MSYSCPSCGHEVKELPEPVKEEFDRGSMLADMAGRPDIKEPDDADPRYVMRTKGAHSDQLTRECPECGHEGWDQGWRMDETPEA